MTLAWMLRITLALSVGIGTAVGVMVLPDAAPWWGAVLFGLAAPPLFTGALLALELAIGAAVDPRRPRRSIGHVLQVWLGETLASSRMFLWRQPFAADFPELPIVRDPRRPAVLLIHGYLCNRAVWRPLLDSRLLRDCNVATVNLEPVFGPIERYSDVIAAAVQSLLAASGAEKAVLVCHSMGGIAARVYLQQHGAARVERVITLASPHHGTVFAHAGLGANARQMRTGWPFLARLAAGEDETLRSRFTCVGTRDDNLVVPRSSPLLPGARPHQLDRVGHLALLEDERAWHIVGAEIATSRPLPSTTPLEAQSP